MGGTGALRPTLTVKTESERLLCSTIFQSRSEQFTKSLTLSKGEQITISGWFSAPFPNVEEEEDEGIEMPRDGYLKIEELFI